MEFSRPISEIIKIRKSRRLYGNDLIRPAETNSINAYLQANSEGPFGSKLRFKFVSATDERNKGLDKLGTYGFISNPAGYIIGAVNPGPKNLEDFGYILEKVVLKVTDLGIDSCWIGATFTVNEFSKKIGANSEEVTPAVISLGYATDERGAFERLVLRGVRAHKRLPWETLFFHADFKSPLSENDAGAFVSPLEMVRIGPSASNRQPWRFIKVNDSLWHLYLCRTGFYPQLMRIFGRVDIQRLDMGIAMYHFKATCMEEGIDGEWVFDKPAMIDVLPGSMEYVASFMVMQKDSKKP